MMFLNSAVVYLLVTITFNPFIQKSDAVCSKQTIWTGGINPQSAGNLLIGGYDIGRRNLGVCHAFHDGDLIPGTRGASAEICYVSKGGLEHQYRFNDSPTTQSLYVDEASSFAGCSDYKVEWGALSSTSIIGGRTATGDTLYIARCILSSPYGNGALTQQIGKLHASRPDVAFIPLDGREWMCSNFQVASWVRQPKLLEYTFNVEYISAAPDGVLVNHVLAVNQQYPGIEIRAQVGDTLHVRLVNNIIDSDGVKQGSTLHWHGLFQRDGYNIYDGPDGVTQCAVAYGRSMDYQFPLVQSGTCWWHSHFGTQYTEGLLGPLIVQDDVNDPHIDHYDYDNLVFTVSDWYHTPGKILLANYVSIDTFPAPDSALLNGHGAFDCASSTLPCTKQSPLVYQVQPGATYRIRVISVSTFWTFKFYIDGHKLEVIEVDGVPTQRVPCDFITLAAAQRYSVLVTMNSDTKVKGARDFLIHSVNMNANNATSGHATGILRYLSDFTAPSTRHFMEAMESDPIGLDERLLIPFEKTMKAPTIVNQKFNLDVIPVEANGNIAVTFNSQPCMPSGAPLLYRMLENESISNNFLPLAINYGNVIEVTIYNTEPFAHPFHLHGHAFWVMASGPPNSGRNIYTYPNPIKRDTVNLNGNATVVFRFLADNPGAWFFHCHINWHHLKGLAATFVEAIDQAKSTLSYPTWAKDICHQSGEIPFSCTVDGLFADPTDCTKYFRCIGISGGFYRYSFSCPASQVFNAATTLCERGICLF